MCKCKKFIVVVFFVFLVSGLILHKFINRHYVVPIIMYHYVHPNPHPDDRLTVTPESFERQMRFLKTHRYNVVPLELLGDLVRDKKKIPPKTIAVTLDDGIIDCYNYAFPILKKYNLPATMFIITDEVGRSQNDRLTWAQIKEMQDSGLVTFGSHCLGPEPLINIKQEEELKRQIFGSKRILEGKLKRPVTAFSYPEGFFTDKIKQLVIEAGYKLAVSTMPGKEYPNDDVLALKRLRISSSSDNLLVFWFETSGIYTFIRECDKDD